MNTLKLTFKTISTHKLNFILSILFDFVFISALVLVQHAFLVPTVEA